MATSGFALLAMTRGWQAGCAAMTRLADPVPHRVSLLPFHASLLPPPSPLSSFFTFHSSLLPPAHIKTLPGPAAGELSLSLCAYRSDHTTPWASMAWAIFRKPATLAPSIRSPGLPHSTEAS